MDKQSREQIRLILDDAADRARKSATGRLRVGYTERNRRGLLHSSITVGEAIETLGEDASRFVADCVGRVAPIEKSIEAFALLSEENERFITFLTTKFDEAVRKGLGGRGQLARAPNFENRFLKMWQDACARSRRQLEIQRFTFTEPSRDSERSTLVHNVALAGPRKNEGGKPLARHWDEMWADIAVCLWTGDLQPQSQADVKHAMLDWLSANNIDAGDSTVVSRARQLWQRLQAEK